LNRSPKNKESDENEINDNDGDNEGGNGPTTLISHLNDLDPNNEDTMQVDPTEA